MRLCEEYEAWWGHRLEKYPDEKEEMVPLEVYMKWYADIAQKWMYTCLASIHYMLELRKIW